MSDYVTKGLEPGRVLEIFEDLCAIPHGSYDTKRISDHVVSFGKALGLKTFQDENNNVVIYKGGSEGYEDKMPVILQGHLDMVCEKDAGCDIDFSKDGLRLKLNDGILTADGTTLGADDGIAVAMCLAILEDDSIMHPPIEAVFTVDEEVGMLGAAAFDYSVLNGKTMINIDSEDEGIFTVGCAGGMTVTAKIPFKRRAFDGVIYKISLTGFLGGHSGQEIDKGRANPNVVSGRLLDRLYESFDIRVADVYGGGKDNAIPRQSDAYISVKEADIKAVEKAVSDFENTVKHEYALTDPDISISISKVENAENAEPMDKESGSRVICALYNMPFGVIKYSAEIEDLVQTSLNMGILETGPDTVNMTFSVRSSIESEKKDLYHKIVNLTKILGGTVESKGEYPAWEFKKDSKLLETAKEVFNEQYGKEPVVEAIHAGLECGMFYEAIDGIEIISIGPDLHDIHTPKETMDIESVRRTYDFVLALLRWL